MTNLPSRRNIATAPKDIEEVKKRYKSHTNSIKELFQSKREGAKRDYLALVEELDHEEVLRFVDANDEYNRDLAYVNALAERGPRESPL